MKKNKIIMILGATIMISIMLVNVAITSNEFITPSISLKSCTALACTEGLEGMGAILLMKNCYWEENYLEGERWVHIEHRGCEDDGSTCYI